MNLFSSVLNRLIGFLFDFFLIWFGRLELIVILSDNLIY